MQRITRRDYLLNTGKHLNVGTFIITNRGMDELQIEIKQAAKQEDLEKLVSERKPGIPGLPYGGYDNVEDQPLDLPNKVYKIDMYGREFIPVKCKPQLEKVAC